MSDSPSDNFGALDTDLALRIDMICRRFEVDWRAGREPHIEAYLGEFNGDGRASLAAELEALQSELQQAAGKAAITGAPTIATGSLPTLAKPGEASSSVHDAATLPPRADVTVDLGASTPASFEAATPSHIRYFGDYEIIREIARGGMGVVFEARQISLNRKVAIKMILAGQLANETDVKRFYTEAEAAANLDHPGIVPIFEVGQHEGLHYFSMGFVEGQSLSHRLAQGPLLPRQAAELILRACEAIEYAHQRCVIHRDLKPANIQLDQTSKPRITDFGLAKRLQTDSGLTGSGQIMGTPSYMPPEQVGGKRGDVGPTADVYALGATLYCALTGRPPFQAATAMDTVIQVVSDEPVPPRRLNATVPRDLETICLKCLEKASKRRYGSARGLADELGRFLAGRPIQARPITVQERAVKWARRQPIIAGLSAAVVVISLIGVAGIVWQWRSAVTAQRESARLATRLTFDRAIERCTHDDANEGLLWLARGLELASGEPMRRLFRLNLDAWSRQVAVLERVSPKEPKTVDLAFSPDGRRVVRGEGQSVRICDLETGSPLGAPLRHGGFVSHAAFSSDGRMLATAARDGTARIWDAETGTPHGEPIDHLGWPIALALAPSGRYVALDSSTLRELKQTIQPNVVSACHIWDLATRRKVAIEPPPREKVIGTESVSHLAFDPTGKTLAVGLGTRVLRWDVLGERFVSAPIEWSFERGMISALAFIPDGDLLIALSGRRILKVHMTASGNLLQTDQELPSRATDLSITAKKPDPWLFAGFSDQTARLMRLPSGGQDVWFKTVQNAGTVLWHPRLISKTALAPDAHILFTCDFQFTERQWRRASGQALGPPTPDSETRNDVKTWTSDDGRRVLVGGHDGVYRLLDGATGRPVGGPLPIPPPDYPAEVPLVVAFSSDGRRMATIWIKSMTRPDRLGKSSIRHLLSQELRAWDAMTGEAMGPPVSIEQLGLDARLWFSPDGRRLMLHGFGGTLILDAATLQRDAVWNQYPLRDLGGMVGASLSPDGRWFYRLVQSSSGQNALPEHEHDACQLWDAVTGGAMGEVSSPDSPISNVIFSPNGRWLATSHQVPGETPGVQRRVTRIWELPSSRPIGTAIEQASPSEFSPDGSILLTRSDAGGRLWDASSGRAIGKPPILRQLTEYLPKRLATSFSPDSRLLAVGSEDRFAELIDASTGRSITSQLPHSAAVVALAFSPDGELLLTGSADGMARFWHVASGWPVGPPLEHSGRRVDRVAFAPDGRSVVTWSRASDSCTIVRHWAAPTAWTGDAAAIRRRVERMTNRRLDSNEVPMALSAEEWHARGDR
jgi:WD40 repeat protein